MLKAAVIGLGVGEAHIQGFNSHPKCEVVKVYDFSVDVQNVARKKYQDIEFVEHEDEIFFDSTIDIVSIASYDNFHYEQIVKGIENKKHLFIEKPIVQFKAQAKDIIDKLDRNNSLVISSNLILRQYEQFMKAKRLFEDGEFGDISSFYASYNYGRINKITEGWRGKIDYYSVVLGGGIHLIDLILWLTKMKVTYVFAVGNNIQTKNTNYRFNDLVTALLYFENGMIATVNSNFGLVTPHFHQFEMYGTKLSFFNTYDHYTFFNLRDSKNHNNTNLLTEERKNSLPNKFTFNKKLKKGYYLYNFVDSILKKKKPIVTQKEIFDTLSVCFAIEESQKLKEKVKVDYLIK